MDSFEFNKIAGAVLGAALFVLIVSTLSDALFSSHPPEEPVYLASLTTSEEVDHGQGGGEAKEESVAMLLATADAGKGENVAKKCAACHTFDNGGADKQGPNLWNIVNRKMGSKEGFSYSAGLASMGEAGNTWDFDSLFAFLRKPKDFVEGTKMAFGGISKAADRADLLAYLRSLSDSPAPLPEAGDQADAGAGAVAETQTAAAESADQASDAPPAEAAPATAETMEKPAEASEGQTDMAAAPASEAPAEKPAAEDKPAEMAAVAPAEAPAAGQAASEPAEGVLAMIGSQDIADGEKVARKCKACHTFEEDGKNKAGPPLWNVVNRPVAAADDFKYSSAMTEFAAGGKTWSYEELDAFLAAPKEHVPKTKMAFAGLKKEEDRAAILAYLRSLSSDPAPLP